MFPLKKLFDASRSTKGRPVRALVPSLQSCEPRRLMAVTPALGLQGATDVSANNDPDALSNPTEIDPTSGGAGVDSTSTVDDVSMALDQLTGEPGAAAAPVGDSQGDASDSEDGSGSPADAVNPSALTVPSVGSTGGAEAGSTDQGQSTDGPGPAAAADGSSGGGGANPGSSSESPQDPTDPSDVSTPSDDGSENGDNGTTNQDLSGSDGSSDDPYSGDQGEDPSSDPGSDDNVTNPGDAPEVPLIGKVSWN
jgi:hypothetical protein